MLLRFSATNFLSVADQQELSLVAVKLKGPDRSLIPVPNVADTHALPVALIYGANASGKTNLIKAFRFMQVSILQSHTHGNPAGGVPRISFALDKQIKASPSQFEADFIVDNIRYVYGFECDDEKFTSEWLYSYPEGKRRKLFERHMNEVDFGPSMKGAKRTLVDFMRSNSLFIATATQNDHEDLSVIVSFFRNIKFSYNVAVSEFTIKNTFKQNQLDIRTINFLKLLGTGIVNYRQKDVEVPDNVRSLTREFVALAKKHIGETIEITDGSFGDQKDVTVELSHEGTDGEEYFFGLERESSGTRRLLLIMNEVFCALDEGGVIFIDEIDASLHTHAVEQILEMFSDPAININGAQLIATTHDTNILSCASLRRDQVWFCEKDAHGATHLFALSDIKSRHTDDFERGYLEGRFGAIPFSGNLRALLLKE